MLVWLHAYACSSEDGNTSIMDYQDDFDVSDPLHPKFGGDYLLEPGVYDEYAILYGYTPLAGEKRGERHHALALLADGQHPAVVLHPAGRLERCREVS